MAWQPQVGVFFRLDLPNFSYYFTKGVVASGNENGEKKNEKNTKLTQTLCIGE